MNRQNATQTHQQKPSTTPATSGLLQRKCACGNHTMAGGECAECGKTKRFGLQTKLKVNQPGDIYEREADRIADQVMATPAHSSVSGAPPRIQRFSGQSNGQMDAAPASVDQALASPGRPLDPALQQDMGQRFGHDFSRVRVHSGTAAERSARDLNAHAYTVGRDIVFGAGRFAPGMHEGRRLIAHELTHVVQQSGAEGIRAGQSNKNRGPSPISPADDQFEREADSVAARVLQRGHAGAERALSTASVQTLQRDLATPPPAVPAAAQPDLTQAQIQDAIAFNRARYNEANTRLIQGLLAGPVTGIWTADNIEAIAATQEEYGLQNDGKVGDETFRFLNNEQRLEGMSTRRADCLTAFAVTNLGATPIARDAATNSCTLSGHFRTQSQFSRRCRCAGFEYRQFIRGHVLQNRGGVQVADLGATQFGRLPAGALLAAFNEDGDTTDPDAQNYGHRANPADATPEDHYIDAGGADDQANGCRYRSEDFTGFINVPGIPDCRVGDQIDADMTFRGEIQRNGAAIQTKQWSAIRGRFIVP